MWLGVLSRNMLGLIVRIILRELLLRDKILISIQTNCTSTSQSQITLRQDPRPPSERKSLLSEKINLLSTNFSIPSRAITCDSFILMRRLWKDLLI